MYGLTSCSKHFIKIGISAIGRFSFRQDTTDFFATGCFEASGDDGLTEGDVEDVSQNICQLTSTGSEHAPWDNIWASCFLWIDPGQGPVCVCCVDGQG